VRFTHALNARRVEALEVIQFLY
jgi:transcription termination factor NusB